MISRQKNNIEALTYVSKLVGYQSLSRYRHRAQFLFSDIDFTGQRVLEVGCGPGTFALWTALHGAKYVVGIEPESAGSTQGSLQIFRKIIGDLSLESNVSVLNTAIEDLTGYNQFFDIVVMFNVINHMDEEAVKILHEDTLAAERYVSALKQIQNIMATEGSLIVADCARSNFWATVGLPSPLARNIEWNKHQNPKTWISLFSKAGFIFKDLRWSPLYPFGFLTANRFAQYFTASHFVLRFKRGTPKIHP
jgi:SAM-dependent methyltransferase